MKCSGGLLQYSGLVTKTRAMHGRLLKKEELVQLSEKEKVEDFINFLKESRSYGKTYKSHEEIHHRSQVEAVIHDSIYSDYMKLYQFANESQRQGLKIIFYRYEINVLKLCLEYAYLGTNRKYNLSYLNIFFDRHSSYDTASITQAGTLQELTNALAGTVYEEKFLRMLENPNLTYADYAFGLDIMYNQSAWRMLTKLEDSKMKKIMETTLGTEIDWLNLMWVYRSKKFYNMKPADIYINTIPIYYRLKKTEFVKMVEAETTADFLELLGKTVYFTDKDAIAKMGEEITYRMIMDRTYEKLCRSYPNSIAPVLKYLYDKEKEIDVLTTILEGIRYQIKPKEIRDMVMLTN